VLFELIKSKCVPILLYNATEVSPTNTADRHSLQFTLNKIVYEIFGAVSKYLGATDMHGETDNICASAAVLSRFDCIAIAFVQFMFVVHVFVSCYHP